VLDGFSSPVNVAIVIMKEEKEAMMRRRGEGGTNNVC
jgi:hypothetical protein